MDTKDSKLSTTPCGCVFDSMARLGRWTRIYDKANETKRSWFRFPQPAIWWEIFWFGEETPAVFTSHNSNIPRNTFREYEIYKWASIKPWPWQHSSTFPGRTSALQLRPKNDLHLRSSEYSKATAAAIPPRLDWHHRVQVKARARSNQKQVVP